MNKKLKKLVLSRETISILNPEDLRWAQGANSVGSAFTNCDACDKLTKTKPPL